MMLLMMTMMIVMVLMAILAVAGLMMTMMIVITFDITYMYRIRTLLSSSNPCLSITISSFS